MTPTVQIMQRCVFDLYLKRGWKFFAQNTKAMGWEADLLAISKADYSAEFEMKLTRKDFRKDFRKPKHGLFTRQHKILWPGPNYFYFVVPDGLVSVTDVPEYAGLIYVGKNYSGAYFYAYVEREAKRLHKDKVKEHVVKNMVTSVMWKQFSKIDINVKHIL